MPHKPRESRRMIYRPARMRIGGEWCDITICNVSSRGFMAKCASPPPRGTYIEVRHLSQCIIARVVWSRELRFGVRARDKIDISLLLEEARAKSHPTGEERRTAPRRPDPHAVAEASRRFARVFEWAALGLAVAVAAGFVLEVATASLNKPMREVREAIGGSKRHG